MAATAYPHLSVNSDGVVYVDGTTTKLIEVVQDHLAHHWDAEDIHHQHPDLGLAQIHAALAYYYDHQAEIDEEIESRRRKVAEIRARRQNASIRNKLTELGHAP